MRKFLARVIVIPAELESWVTAVIMAGFLWVEAQLVALWGINLNGALVALAAGIAMLLTGLVKALLEKLPEGYHKVINMVLSWLGALVAGSALLPVFMRLVG